MKAGAAYYRARLDTFRYFIREELPESPVYTGKKNSPAELLKYGFVHSDIKERFNSRVDSFSTLGIKVVTYRLGKQSHHVQSGFNQTP